MATFTDENRRELDENGYTVVTNVLTEAECVEYVTQFQQWLGSNFAQGDFPLSAHSLVQSYAVGHLEPAWRVRLKSRDVFAQIWGTERLLSSMDAVAIGRPPEDGDESFYNPDTGGWLHLDQTVRRQGLHGYQAAVYLEAADVDDWTLEVVEKSHALYDEYFAGNEDQRRRSLFRGNMKARDEHMDWMTARGCVQKRVPVPRGGMVMWDSRLIHANARPVKGRNHPGRWRWAVFACMAPASWVTEKALSVKRAAYDTLKMTTHWPCDDVGLMKQGLPSYAAQELRPLQHLPEVARSVEAKRLAGVLPYPEAKSEEDKAQELSLLEQRPKWDPEFLPDDLIKGEGMGVAGITRMLMVVAVLAGLLVLAKAVFRMWTL